MTATIEHTSLDAIADQINAAHRDAESAIRESLLRSKQAGELLLQVKSELPHGGFIDWVELQCEFSPRTARRYMKLAERWEELESKTDTIVADLGITDALKILTSDENVHFSSESSEWYTPPEIIEATRAVMGSIDLDPCSDSTSEPNVPATVHYTTEEDGLSQPWAGRVYLNPPYGREIGKWTERLQHEYESGCVTEAIALLPARTDTEWFQKLREYARCFLHGRLRFSDCETSAPFPSVVFYLGNERSRFAKTFGKLGDVCVPFQPRAVQVAATPVAEWDLDTATDKLREKIEWCAERWPREMGKVLAAQLKSLASEAEELIEYANEDRLLAAELKNEKSGIEETTDKSDDAEITNLTEAIKGDGKDYPDSCPICGMSDQVVILPRQNEAGTQYVKQCDRCAKIIRFVPKKEAKKLLNQQEADQLLAAAN